jgi:hypothetical protein
MATLNAPIRHADSESVLGQDVDYLGLAVLQQLTERFDVLTGPMATFLGDLAGSGSDTLRIRNATGYGYAGSFTAMSTETQSITASSITANFDAFTVSRNGIAYESTFQRDALASDGLNIDALAASIPDAWASLLRSKVCTVGAAFTTNKADAAATLDVDDMINLRAGYEESAGFDLAVHGAPYVMLHPSQITKLRASIRSETSLQMPDAFAALQGIQSQSGLRFRFLDMDVYGSNDVSLAGGDYYGFSSVRGGIGFVVASTANIPVPTGVDAVRVPEFGLLITKSADGSQAYNRVDANAWLGVAAASSTVAPQFLMRSQS